MRSVAIVVIGWLAITGDAHADTYGVTLPRGSRQVSGDRYTSGRGMRDTIDHVARELDRRGIGHRRIGPYRVRGVDVARFLVEDAGSAFAAIHVYRVDGKTMIFFVKRST
jgi:hypothetical protein